MLSESAKINYLRLTSLYTILHNKCLQRGFITVVSYAHHALFMVTDKSIEPGFMLAMQYFTQLAMFLLCFTSHSLINSEQVRIVKQEIVYIFKRPHRQNFFLTST